MHDLVVFFSMLGGIGMFGVMGFIIGPILAALFLTLLHIGAFIAVYAEHCTRLRTRKKT